MIAGNSSREPPAVLAGELDEALGVLLLAEFEDREQELDLRREVVQQGLASDADLGGDHVQRGAAVAAGGELVHRDAHDLLARHSLRGGCHCLSSHGDGHMLA